MQIYDVLLIALCCLMFVILIVLVMWMRASYAALTRSVLNESERAHHQEMDQFKNQMQDDLNEMKDRMNHDLVLFQNTIAHSLRSDMSTLSESTARQLNRIELSVSDSLMKGFENTSQSFASVAEQMARIDETQKNLKQLSENIVSLESILTDKKTRGTFGEIELYSILETVFGSDGLYYQKQVKLSSGAIADCVIKGPSSLGNLVIDSKFPLENYNRMAASLENSPEYKKAASDFRHDVKIHLQTIADKYLIASETAEFACMFIPAEAVFAQIVAHFDDLVQFSYQKRVYLVSPTTLMAYLNAIKAFYLEWERSKQMVEIQKEYQKLSQEFERFVQRWKTVMRDFDKLREDARALDITSEKIIRRFRDIESVELSEKDTEISLVNETESDNIICRE